jgi:hypothetical protein
MNYQKKAQTFVVCMTMMMFGLFTVVVMQLG